MKTPYHYAGLVLLVSPVAYLLYRSWRADQLKPILQGAALALLFSAWVATVTYLLSR